MKFGGIAIVVLALVLAGAVAFLINEWLDSQQADIADRRAALEAEQARLEAEQKRLADAGTEIVPAPETIPVLAAAEPLAVGTTLEPEMLKLINLPPDAKPQGAFSKPSEVLGEVVIQPISAGEIILPTRLTQGSGVPLAVRIKPGMRAITLNVDDASTLAGMLEPDSRVDIILDTEDSSSEDTLRMQNVKVLAVGQQLDAVRWRDDNLSRAVTLEVTPRQALILARKANDSLVRLILRNTTDPDTVTSTETRTLTLIRGTEQCTTQAGRDCR